jgi:hypothetical protein
VTTGPFAWPFIGNVIPIATLYHHVYYSQLRSKYGPVFKVRSAFVPAHVCLWTRDVTPIASAQVWMGTTPWVIVCEPDSIR